MAGAESAVPSNAQRILDVLPFVIMLAVSLTADLVGPGGGLLSLLSLGPAFAAVTGGVRKTVIVGVVALALCALMAVTEVIGSWDMWALDSATVAGVTVAAVIASSVRQRRERELAEVGAIAEVAQQVLLRPVPREMNSVKLAVRYMSATSRAQIGGDLYEVVPVEDCCRVIVGDVQGKGLIGVKAAATVLGAFREVAHDAADLHMIAERIELSLGRQLTTEQFVTALLAEISSDGSKIQLLSCGHPPPLLVSDGESRFIEPAVPSLPLGLSHLAAVPRDVTTVPFGPGDQLLLYTDGVTEARDRAGAFYNLADCRAFNSGDDPEDVLSNLQHEVLQHVGHALDDDAAMLLIRREPALLRPGAAHPDQEAAWAAPAPANPPARAGLTAAVTHSR
jgi:serine phosphatase RsbU (regulator of sigma subunit)